MRRSRLACLRQWARGDLHRLLSQNADDRLDRMPLSSHLIDEAPHQRLRGSSSPAKKVVVNSTRQRNSAWSLSAGVSKSRVFLGREFKRAATVSRSAWVRSFILTPFGKY